MLQERLQPPATSDWVGQAHRQLLARAGRKPGDAARQANGPLQVGDVTAFFPSQRSGGRRRVPEVIHAGAVEHRNGLNAARAQAAAEIIVLAAPAEKLFVEAVDPLELGAGQGEIAAAKCGLGRVADQAVPDRLEMHLPELAALIWRGPVHEFAATHSLERRMLRYGMIQANAIAARHGASPR